jgi:hypothetical protein
MPFAFYCFNQEDVSQCLETASENLVLDSLGCDFEGSENATLVSESIDDNSPIRKLQSSPTQSAVSLESSLSLSSSSSLAQPAANYGTHATTSDRRTSVDDWEEVDEKIILAFLMNEGQDSRFLDMDMSMQPTPHPTLPPTTRPPTPRRTPAPAVPPTTAPSPAPAVPPTAAPSPPPASPPTTSTPAPTPSPSADSPLTFPPSGCPYVVQGKVDSIVEFRTFAVHV